MTAHSIGRCLYYWQNASGQGSLRGGRSAWLKPQPAAWPELHTRFGPREVAGLLAADYNLVPSEF